MWHVARSIAVEVIAEPRAEIGSVDGRHEEDWYEAERRLGPSPYARQSSSTPQQTAAQLDDVDTRDRTPG